MVSFDESNIEEEIAELRREIASGGDSKQGEKIRCGALHGLL